MSGNCTTVHALMLSLILSLLLAHDHHLFPFSKPPTTTTKLPPTRPSSSCNCPIPAFTILLAFLSGVFFSILSLLTLRFPPFLNNLLRSCLSCIKRRRPPQPPAPTTLHRQTSKGGISDGLLNTLPTFSYSGERRRRLGRGGRVCAICLSEFLNEQTLRWLPDCDHLFHRHCIDTWLASHTSCPCCRANLDNSGDEIDNIEILPLDNGVNSGDGGLDIDRRFGCEGGAIGGLLRLLVGRRRQQGRRLRHR